MRREKELPPAWLGATMIVAATVLAYAGSLSGPFVFDDVLSIAQNPTLRHFSAALSPPAGGLTVSGRPVLNLSFAINSAISGSQVWSYHAANLLIHLLAALTLFGIVRRTPPRSTLLALAVALFWALHPLQTESVTYVVQRAESLMGLFYLLTLYAFIRGTAHGDAAAVISFRWLGLSAVACLLGMGTKEVMVTAPVLVLLYDRTFVSGSFPAAWRARRSYYAFLAGTWLLLGFLVVGAAGRGGTVGFAAGMPWWEYGVTQFRAIAHYLRLSLWPAPLIFDYGPVLGGKVIELAMDATLVIGLAVVSLVLFFRRRPLGFLGVSCFLILLPSSSVVPVATETVAEHRMYLSLAALLAAVVGGIWALGEKLRPTLGQTSQGITRLALAGCLIVAAILGIETARRNEAYRSPRTLWSDTVAKLPDNARAHNNFGFALIEENDPVGAEAQFRAALALSPDFASAHVNLGNVLAKHGQLAEAVENYQGALRFVPRDPEVHEDLGTALLRLGRTGEARGEIEEALRLDPNSAVGHFDLGCVLDREKQRSAAAAEYQEALHLNPNYPDAWYNLANLFVHSGKFADAADAYAAAVRLQPTLTDAHVNYGNVLTQLNRITEAIGEFQVALRLQPGAVDVHDTLGDLLVRTGRLEEARAQYEAARRLDSGDQAARAGLKRVDAGRGPQGGP
jgi:tetratricopeptide (TPR) repeat protein